MDYGNTAIVFGFEAATIIIEILVMCFGMSLANMDKRTICQVSVALMFANFVSFIVGGLIYTGLFGSSWLVTIYSFYPASTIMGIFTAFIGISGGLSILCFGIYAILTVVTREKVKSP